MIIIHQGAIITNESRDQLLSQGYTVSGSAKKVDDFIAEQHVLGVDMIGGLKSAYIIGDSKDIQEGILRDAVIANGLEITKLNLQQLFIKMTNDEEETA